MFTLKTQKQMYMNLIIKNIRWFETVTWEGDPNDPNKVTKGPFLWNMDYRYILEIEVSAGKNKSKYIYIIYKDFDKMMEEIKDLANVDSVETDWDMYEIEHGYEISFDELAGKVELKILKDEEQKFRCPQFDFEHYKDNFENAKVV